ncbi:MAG: biotin carboxylase N-terminal domain-containing protein [Rhizomicrobium sp.]
MRRASLIKTLLIANRGEIAVRVMRTARRLGIRTVAVYSDADTNALHVAAADEAVRIGPAPVRDSYLRGDAILAAAQRTGAEAIHPGYGFLSENAEFAEACAAASVLFVGPPAGAIRAMGLKDRAKALMQQAGVPVVPGYLGDNQEADHLATEAGKIGYPVLIKAVAGGGGKGMRRVDEAADFPAALAGAKREAASAFGDDKVLIEKYVARPRHIEVQVFADGHGRAVHLFERDCSLQRRHQKVIEEAPAPGMSAQMRAHIGAIAVKAAKSVGYVGAGTIEFIADSSDGLRPDRIWFMEMNTRLQVEHPVTEAITGYDLVEWQLRVASGEALPAAQADIRATGHAIEARLYAEDPQKGFLPSIGTLECFSLPQHGVRVDTGVREGDRVTPFYDPMLAKVIAHGETRQAAALALASALSRTCIAGLRTNNAFLVRALRNGDFIAGEVDTGFIARREADLIPSSTVPARIYEMVAGDLLRGPDDSDPWSRRDGFRLAGRAAQVAEFVEDGERITVNLPGISPGHAEIRRLANGDVAVMENGETFVLHPFDPFAAADAAGAATDRIVTPMPGKIIQLLVTPGESVKRGQPLAVLEAMKMEHTLSAPADAKVKSVEVAQGDQVGDGAVVVRFEAAA